MTEHLSASEALRVMTNLAKALGEDRASLRVALEFLLADIDGHWKDRRDAEAMARETLDRSYSLDNPESGVQSEGNTNRGADPERG